ncbi:BRCA1 C terminus domain-containing protein [Phlyctema vagabunda]|uniref:BRCA1 C terminus domain-containing protein n=1 Tax=Phlyctema vagabunda TaxID=108571 RepID=A0ABR4PBR8_9HELO
MADDTASDLFSECVFAIVISKETPIQSATDFSQILKDHGGQVHLVQKDGGIDFDDVTHIISGTSDFAQYATARQFMVPVVMPSWISASLHKRKQAPLRPHTPDGKLFFRGVQLSCADIPTGDKDAIIGAVLAMGGLESSAITRLTTHVCALSMDHPKCVQVAEKKLKCKIVLPHWFDDCLKLGKMIDSKPYELPDPEIFQKEPEEGLAFPISANIEGAVSPDPTSIPLPSDANTRKLQVFHDRVVKISQDLGLSTHLRQVLENLIRGGGGRITKSVHEADMYICKYREGREYVFASCAGIDVGNLSWLYYLIANDEWTSPLLRLLHYPLPRDGIPGFKDFRITLSNYGGDARIYLENLVIAAGGEYTKSMKQDNTHLITARENSEKCTAAAEWNINMVNHLWIEDSYVKGAPQSLTIPRYTHFPPRTNLGEIIGQTELDLKILREKHFPRAPTPGPDDPKILRPVRDNHAQKLSPTAKDETTSDDEMEVDVENAVPTKKVYAIPTARRKPKASLEAQTVTPIANRKSDIRKEIDTPSSTSSRSAKDKALSNLHAMAPDVALYEKERKRITKGIWGGKRAANQIDKERAQERSSSPAVKSNVHEISDDEEEAPVSKRAKTNGPKVLPPISIRLIITGYTRWLHNRAKEETEKRKLRELGILITTDPINCTHLAAPALVRTQKFLCALASGPTVISTEFVDKCIDDKEVHNVDDFLLKDRVRENPDNKKLKDIVVRAQANKRRLLQNVPVYCTAEIGKNLPETYESIVKANGGLFSIYRARGGMMIKPTKPEEDEDGNEPVYLITGLRPDEKKLWPKFEEMAKAGNMEPRIVLAEWLLEVALSQKLTWNPAYLATK